MSEERRTVEVSDMDVDTAVNKGLAMLDATLEDVEVEVLDRGSRGLLGLGSRDALVRLTLRGGATAAVTAQPAQPPVEPSPPIPVPPPAPQAQAPTRIRSEKPSPATSVKGEDATTGEVDELTIALEIVHGLLDKMGIEAETEGTLSEPDDRTGRQSPMVSIAGEDLSLLIGPRGETLNALQFVARIMTGHRLRRRSNLLVDVAGYRERRRQALTRLAERMAGKVVKRNQPVTLEPMPPYERRLIHLALRDHEQVYTESAGEGNRRRVRIYPKAD